MNRTRGKLEEARFFLGELERTYYEHVEELERLASGNHKPPVCQYYLSAFISSARSVMWVMRSEYQAAESWEEWYQSKKPNSDDKELLGTINAVRVRSEKQAPLNLGYNIAFNDVSMASDKTELDESKPTWRRKQYHLKVHRVIEDGEEVEEMDRVIEFKGEISSFFWAIEEFPNKDILAVCKKYFTLLEDMVGECEERFLPR
jgi:hypothetical protein